MCLHASVCACVRACARAGKIVPVQTTLGLLRKAMDKHMQQGKTKFLIDGFPRSQDNWQGWLDHMTGSAVVRFMVAFQCPNEILLQRILGRGQSSGRVDDNKARLRCVCDWLLLLVCLSACLPACM